MAAATLPQMTLSPEVRAFLQQHQAERALEKLCAVVRECYPQSRDIVAEIADDPDIADRRKVLLWVQLPASMSMESYHAQHEAYHERLHDEIPLSQLDLFGVLTEFSGE